MTDRNSDDDLLSSSLREEGNSKKPGLFQVEKKSKFRTSANNKLITQGLFIETSYTNTDNCLFTLTGKDRMFNGKMYPSIQKLYLEMEDVTEYQFANTYFEDWDHWERICSNKMILAHIEKWRRELEIRMRSNSLISINNMSEDNLAAAKYIANGEWKKAKIGRPSNKDKAEDRIIEEGIERDFSSTVTAMKAFREGRGG